MPHISTRRHQIIFCTVITLGALVLSYGLGRLFMPDDVFFNYAIYPTFMIPLLVAIPISWIVSEQLRTIHMLNQKLTNQLNHDHLTGLGTRRWFFEAIGDLDATTPHGLLLLDMDRFKVVNDTHGHDGGDAVLAEAAKRFIETVDAQGQVFRFGGEEIAVLLPNSDETMLQDCAERLRKVMDDMPVPHAGRAIRATVSIGATVWQPGTPIRQALKSSDIALYRAKEAGRNRVCYMPGFAGPPQQDATAASPRRRQRHSNAT
jgi:diguanylate cyclase